MSSPPTRFPNGGIPTLLLPPLSLVGENASLPVLEGDLEALLFPSRFEFWAGARRARVPVVAEAVEGVLAVFVFLPLLTWVERGFAVVGRWMVLLPITSVPPRAREIGVPEIAMPGPLGVSVFPAINILLGFAVKVLPPIV